MCENLQNISENIYNVSVDKLYLNFNLNTKIFYDQISDMLCNEDIIKKSNKIQSILIDFSSPNIAKDMHVGHLRSTIIGDCLANIMETLGHKVYRVNHIGDFGLPIAMIIQYIISQNLIEDLYNNRLSLTLQDIYISKQKFYLKMMKNFKNFVIKILSNYKIMHQIIVLKIYGK